MSKKISNGPQENSDLADHKINTRHAVEMEQLISHKPSFMVRWGITIFFLILLVLIGICAFIQYPDVVNANGKLAAVNAPKQVTVRKGGRLVKLFTKEGQPVTANEIIGYIESTADHAAVLNLSADLDSIHSLLSENKSNETITFLENDYKTLGELQQPYQNFSAALLLFSNYLEKGFYLRKKEMLRKDITYLHMLRTELTRQKNLLAKDLALADSTFKMNEILTEQKVLSALDYRNEKSKLIIKELTMPQVNTAIINNENQQHEKKKEIAALENEIEQQKSIFLQALNNMKSSVEEWAKKYLLTSPIAGTVRFTTYVQENLELKEGQLLCFVDPGEASYYIEAWLPQQNFGKIKTGQKCLLAFNAYPVSEFGKVEAVLEFVSLLPSDSGYLARLDLPQGLKTNFKHQLVYQAGLTSTVEVITNKRSLLSRLIGQLRNR